MTQVMTFPQELERNFFRDLDYTFAAIWLAAFLIFNSTAFYMQSLPVKPLSAEEVMKFTQAIYRVKVEKTKPEVQDVPKTGVSTAEPVSEPVIASKVEDDKLLSVEEKRAQREMKKMQRQAEFEANRKAIANRFKILAGPTSKGNRSKRSAESAAAAVGLQTNDDVSGVDLSKGVLGIVSNAKDAQTVKSARGDGIITEDIGDLSVSDINNLLKQPGRLEEMLQMAPLKLPKGTVTSPGTRSKAAGRSQQAISQVVLANQRQVQYCYWMHKRRVTNLTGQVVVEFTISPKGAITKVGFRKSDWSVRAVRKEIERSIRNIIMQWRFDPIAESDGDVVAIATFIFE